MAQKPQLGQEQRLTFRVVVRASAGVDAHLMFAGRKLAARVGDISAEGMFVTLERGPFAARKVDTMVDVVRPHLRRAPTRVVVAAPQGLEAPRLIARRA